MCVCVCVCVCVIISWLLQNEENLITYHMLVVSTKRVLQKNRNFMDVYGFQR